MRNALYPVVLAFVLLVFAGHARAADPAPDAPPAAVGELVRLLADPAVQAWLARAPAAAPEPAAVPSGGMTMTSRIDHTKERLAMLRLAAERLPAEAVEAVTIMSFELDGETTVRTLTAVGVFLALGILGEAWFRRATRRVRAELERPAAGGLSTRLGRTGLRLLLGVVDVGAFALCSAGVFLSLSWPPIVGLLTFTTLAGLVAVRLVLAVSAHVLAPRAAGLRLVPVGDAAARGLQAWVGVLAAVAAAGVLLTQALGELGLLRESRPLIPAGFGAAAGLLLIGFVWRVRGAARERAHRTAAAGFLGALGELWPILAALGIALVWIAFVIGAGRIGWTLIVLGLTAALIPLVRSVIDAAGGGGSEEASVLLPTARRSAGVAVLLAGVAVLAALWGVDLLTGDGGGPVVNALFHVAVALLLADLIWNGARAVIDRRIGPAAGAPGLPEESEGGAATGPEARLRTLLPLVRSAVFIALVVVVGLIVLSALGIDIAPLLAGAGIVGLAIGFGAQALVRDIVSGFFFLVEDAFRIGEYVEFGSLRGTVEGISLRSMRLRHHLGAVHTVPYGEIKSLTNHSRDWTMIRLEFRLPFDTDLTLVRKIVKRIGAEMAADPEYAADFLMPLKSQGVRRWEEFNMVVGVKFCTRPGRQWVIRRDAYQRIRDAFEAAGIRFASRDVTVRVSPGAAPAEVEAAAAQAALEAGAPAAPAATAASR